MSTTPAPDPALPDADAASPDETRPGRMLSWLLSAAFVVMVSAPLVAMGLGARPTLPDNRAATTTPTGGDLAALDIQAWEQAQQAFRDRLPGLDWAVERDAQIDLAVTGRSSNPQVVLGKDNWLFLAETIDRPCLTPEDRVGIRDLVDRLRAATDAAGLRLLVVVAPDKAAIRPDVLRDDDRQRSCAAADLDTLAEDLAGDDVLVPAELLRSRAATGDDVYYRHDTHWSPDSAAAVVAEVVARLGLPIEDMTREETGQRPSIGDLNGMLGFPMQDPFRCFNAVRDGVTLTGKHPDCRWFVEQVLELTATSSGPPLLGPTVLQFDSFGLPMIDLLGPWFSRLTAVYKDNGRDEDLTAALASADTLVFEVVQRTLLSDLVAGEVDRLVRLLAGVR